MPLQNAMSVWVQIMHPSMSFAEMLTAPLAALPLLAWILWESMQQGCSQVWACIYCHAHRQGVCESLTVTHLTAKIYDDLQVQSAGADRAFQLSYFAKGKSPQSCAAFEAGADWLCHWHQSHASPRPPPPPPPLSMDHVHVRG